VQERRRKKRLKNRRHREENFRQKKGVLLKKGEGRVRDQVYNFSHPEGGYWDELLLGKRLRKNYPWWSKERTETASKGGGGLV